MQCAFQIRICADNFTCCHTEIGVTGQVKFSLPPGYIILTPGQQFLPLTLEGQAPSRAATGGTNFKLISDCNRKIPAHDWNLSLFCLFVCLFLFVFCFCFVFGGFFFFFWGGGGGGHVNVIQNLKIKTHVPLRPIPRGDILVC